MSLSPYPKPQSAEPGFTSKEIPGYHSRVRSGGKETRSRRGKQFTPDGASYDTPTTPTTCIGSGPHTTGNRSHTVTVPSLTTPSPGTGSGRIVLRVRWSYPTTGDPKAVRLECRGMGGSEGRNSRSWVCLGGVPRTGHLDSDKELLLPTHRRIIVARLLRISDTSHTPLL